MTLASDPRPQEFGADLARTRDDAGVSLGEIVERTKISRRLLEALESGDFVKLPGRAFARMFLKQYLAIIGERPEPWIEAFEGAWRHYQEASASSLPAIPAVPTERRRVVPWIGGVALVMIAFLAVLAVVRRSSRSESMPVATVIPATPRTSLTGPFSAPEPTSPAPAPTAAVAPEAGELAITALDRDCWVEVAVTGETTRSRLLSAGERWVVDLGSRTADLTVGDAGAVEVELDGRRIDTGGISGRVVHLRVGADTDAGAVDEPPVAQE